MQEAGKLSPGRTGLPLRKRPSRLRERRGEGPAAVRQDKALPG